MEWLTGMIPAALLALIWPMITLSMIWSMHRGDRGRVAPAEPADTVGLQRLRAAQVSALVEQGRKPV